MLLCVSLAGLFIVLRCFSSPPESGAVLWLPALPVPTPSSFLPPCPWYLYRTVHFRRGSSDMWWLRGMNEWVISSINEPFRYKFCFSNPDSFLHVLLTKRHRSTSWCQKAACSTVGIQGSAHLQFCSSIWSTTGETANGLSQMGCCMAVKQPSSGLCRL